MPLFSQPAAGNVLELFTSGGPLGLDYVKGAGYESAGTTLTDPTLLAPRGSGHCECWIDGKTRPVMLDATGNLLLPKGTKLRVVGRSSLVELVALTFKPEILRDMAAEYGIKRADLTKAFAETRRIPRTLWMSEIGHRYFFERVMCKKSGNKATAFLEAEIAKEVYYAADRTKATGGSVPAFLGPQTLAKKAAEYIEKNLFEDLSLETIARAAAASRAALLRSFKRELGISPFAYIHERRMQEAASLLRSGRYQIAQVAEMIGYKSVSAFTQAFRRTHGLPPSDFMRASR